MSFPDWGTSYNALYVPLSGGWRCTLMTKRELEQNDWYRRSSRFGGLSYAEREEKESAENRQREEDRRDFDVLFRARIDASSAHLSSDFRAYIEFIRHELRALSWDVPVDGDGVTRILRHAARDGRIVASVNRNAWFAGTQRVFKWYAPQNWPKASGGASFKAEKDEVIGWREFAALRRANGESGFDSGIDASSLSAVSKFASGAGGVVSGSGASASGGGFDWLGAVEAVAGTVFGGATSGSDGGGNPMLKSFGGDDSLLGDAQPFDYVPDDLGGEIEQLAASTNNPNYAAKMLGYERKIFGKMVHTMKDGLDLGGADNVLWHDNGDIEFKGDIIGNMHDYN